MKKLITAAIVAAALAVPATPAFAIHDPNVPAGICSNPGSQAVGHPAAGVLNNTPAGPALNPGKSELGVLKKADTLSPACANNPG
jgi:hypothetical protein